MVTIHASKVSERARPMLLRLQREAKRVLADHFFKRNPGTELAGAIVVRLLDAITETQRQNGVILERLTKLETAPRVDSPYITQSQYEAIRSHKKAIVRLMVELGDESKSKAAHMRVWEQIQRASNWFGKSATLATMPRDAWLKVDRYLNEKRSELERRSEARAPRQTELFRNGLVSLRPVSAGI
jgi:hypothetical protein